jgi:hypothetical protein
MGMLDIGIEARRAGADVQDGNGAQLGQVVQCLVDGLQRDVGHVVADPLVHPLRRRVGDVTLEGPEDALPLRGDFAAVGPEAIGQRVR